MATPPARPWRHTGWRDRARGRNKKAVPGLGNEQGEGLAAVSETHAGGCGEAGRSGFAGSFFSSRLRRALPFFLIHRPFYPASAVFTDTAQKRSGRGKQSLWMCSIEEMERGEPGLLLRASLKQYERFLQSLHFTENFQKASVDVEHLSDFPSVTSSRFGAQPRARLCRPHR